MHDSQYQVFAGIVDGDLGLGDADRHRRARSRRPRSRASTSSSNTGPDLLKGAVTGSITGTDLGPITDPEAYGTSILIDTTTGATVGFQMISPIVAQPIPFSAPFDTSTIDPTATYVARGSVWDGTTLWNTPTGTAVITKDNPKSGVVLTVVPAVTTATPPDDTGRNWFLLLLLLAAIGVGVFLWWRSRQEPEGPMAPPPPPGPDSPPPPPADEPDATAAGAQPGAGASGAGGGGQPG